MCVPNLDGVDDFHHIFHDFPYFFLVCIFIIICLHFGSSFVTCFLKMSSKHKPKYIYFVVPSYSVFFYFDFWFVVMNHYFCLCCLIIPRVYDSLHFFVGSLNIKVCIRNINGIYWSFSSVPSYTCCYVSLFVCIKLFYLLAFWLCHSGPTYVIRIRYDIPI